MNSSWETHGPLASGKLTVYNIENGPVEIVDLPINSMVIFHSYVNVCKRLPGRVIGHEPCLHQGQCHPFCPRRSDSELCVMASWVLVTMSMISMVLGANR